MKPRYSSCWQHWWLLWVAHRAMQLLCAVNLEQAEVALLKHVERLCQLCQEMPARQGPQPQAPSEQGTVPPHQREACQCHFVRVC